MSQFETDVQNFYAALPAMSSGDWDRVLNEWNRLKDESTAWGTALNVAGERATKVPTGYDPRAIEERVFQILHEPLERILERNEPEAAVVIKLELMKATTIAVKALSLRNFLEPPVFSLLYGPFARRVPVRGAGVGGGCLLVLINIRF